jgi:hypothetical protein
VTIRLEADGDATRLHLVHEFADEGPRNEHEQGWRFQLSLFANLVADEVFKGAADLVDGWFSAWAEADAAAREQAFTRVVRPDVRFRDRFSLIDGLSDLVAHTGAYQRFMPGVRVQRTGSVRHCQGSALAEWIGVAGDGQPRMSGTTVFVLDVDGKIAAATGFISRE